MDEIESLKTMSNKTYTLLDNETENPNIQD